MKDPFSPRFVTQTQPQIDVSIESTDALVANQGYTYNQAGLTYNNAGIQYGGVYKTNQDIVPLVSQAGNIAPELTGDNTDAQLASQGYTYNQPGFTYNQPGVFYGGIYNTNQDIRPAYFNDIAALLNPSISSIIDVGTQPGSITPPAGNSGMLIGMLGLLYP